MFVQADSAELNNKSRNETCGIKKDIMKQIKKLFQIIFETVYNLAALYYTINLYLAILYYYFAYNIQPIKIYNLKWVVQIYFQKSRGYFIEKDY